MHELWGISDELDPRPLSTAPAVAPTAYWTMASKTKSFMLDLSGPEHSFNDGLLYEASRCLCRKVSVDRNTATETQTLK